MGEVLGRAETIEPEHGTDIEVFTGQFVQAVVVTIEALLEESKDEDGREVHSGTADVWIDARVGIIRGIGGRVGVVGGRDEEVRPEEVKDLVEEIGMGKDELNAGEYSGDIIPRLGVEFDLFDGSFTEFGLGLSGDSHASMVPNPAERGNKGV